MRNGIEMNINADDFLGIIKTHLSETLGQEIEVNAEWVTRYSGIYEDKSDDVEISYRKKEKINNYNVTVTVTLNKEDLKEMKKFTYKNFIFMPDNFRYKIQNLLEMKRNNEMKCEYVL